MDIVLNKTEIRVLGSLIEKEITTPEYYPLSLNALVNACNQKSNRDPVMELTDKQAVEAIDSLRTKRLAWQRSVTGDRVMKYEHNLRSLFTLSDKEIAVICTSLLRGPQTAGEIKTRAERMATFQSLEETVSVLETLAKREDGPFMVELPRQAGRKENRYVHLFGTIEEYSVQGNEPEPGVQKSPASDRITVMQQIQELRSEIEGLKSVFDQFKKQFE